MSTYYDYQEDYTDKVEYYTWQLNRAIERMDTTAIAFHSAKVIHWVDKINSDIADDEIMHWFSPDDRKLRGL